MARARIVDVSELEPPRPMEVALESLRDLGADEYLVFRHRHEPRPLYATLTEMGFSYLVREGTATAVEVLIWREGTTTADEVLIWAGDGAPPEADA